MGYRKKLLIYRSILGVMLSFCGLLTAFIWNEFILPQMPDKIMIYQGQDQDVHFPIPVRATLCKLDDGTGKLSNDELCKPKKDTVTQTIEYDQTQNNSENLTMTTPIVQTMNIIGGTGTQYQMQLSALGIVPMQSISVEVVSPKKVTLSGEAIGIFLKTQGVLVIDTGNFDTAWGKSISPAKDILQSGDYILKINGQNVNAKKDVTSLIQDCRGKELVFTIQRNGEISEVVITPEQDEQGIYKIGIWVRDSAQGIGTVTYVTEEGEFGALGHGIGDTDTQALMHLGKGSVYETEILAITKGEAGTPGQLTGMISFEQDDYLGKLTDNTNVGVFGVLKDIKEGEDTLTKQDIVCPVALKQEVKRGEAQIYCDINGTPEFYDAKIERISYNGGEDNRQIMLTVTDNRLLEQTGGIVQGMSGSPIVQEGKIIGAVTHVFVNDPTKGYGIFIENMLCG